MLVVVVLPCVPAMTSDSSRQELLVQQGGHRGKGNALVQHALHLRVAPRQSVANHHQVRLRFEIRFGVRLQNRNAQLAEQVAHGRIGRLVRPRDAVPLQLQKPRQRSHRRPANPAQMNMPGSFLTPDL